MALTTYATLQTAVISALHRSDLASVIPDFITLAEDKFNKRFRLRAMENRVTASISSEYLSLPTGFLAMRNFQLNTSPRASLEYATPDYLDGAYPDNTDTGQPRIFTFIGGEIQLAPVPDTTYTAEMDYYKKFDLATDSTNWLLTNAPRVYYYGTLVEACLYLKDDKRAVVWGTILENAIKEVELSDYSDRLPERGLQMVAG